MGEAETAAAAATRAMGALKCILMMDVVGEIDDACVYGFVVFSGNELPLYMLETVR